MERDIFMQCSKKLGIWAKDTVSLYDMAELDRNKAVSAVMFQLASLLCYIAIEHKMDKGVIIELVDSMWKDGKEAEGHDETTKL